MSDITVKLTESQIKSVIGILQDEEIDRFEDISPASAGFIIRIRKTLETALVKAKTL